MIVYQADKTQFLSDNDEREIDEVIQQQFRRVTGRSVPDNEVRSWRDSLGRMANVLRDAAIPDDTGIAIEYHIPQSSKRIDVLVTGHGANRRKNAVIVELKQWESAEATRKDAIVRTFIGRAEREVVHPSYQAWSYAALLEGFNEAVHEGGVVLHPCAYLHNYAADGAIDAAHYEPYIQKAPLFLKGEAERQRLRQFIREHVHVGDAGSIVRELEQGAIRPSKALADSLKKLIKGNPEFVLIDDQKAVYEAALAAGEGASAQARRTVIIEGGPGTGKTVLAINLLVALTNKGLNCRYVSRNAAPRAVFKAKLTRNMSRNRFDMLFCGSGAFVDCGPAEFDVLIVDEAHRLNEKSGLYGNQGDHQVRELIKASKCTIFLIDEDQRVTLKDIGSVDLIRELADEQSANVETYELVSQFRCGGSDGYLAWLDNTLQVRETANPSLDGIPFDFRVYDDPAELHAAIQERNHENKARVVAGYCWNWASKRDPSAIDITIGNYRRQWNLTEDGSLWIIAETSVEQVGCIHTCQGLEVDYIGVIIGPDLVVRDGQVCTVPEARSGQDQSIKGYKQFKRRDPAAAARAAERVIKNTYRTLMSRGMKGCYVYCTDSETREYLKKRVAL